MAQANNNKHVAPPKKLLTGRGATSAELQNEADPEVELYRVSYHYYNDKLCKMSVLSGGSGKNCLQSLRRIGKSTPRTLADNHIRMETINNSGAYAKLFNSAPAGATIREHNIGKAERMFYFLEDNLFHVVAITNEHYKT